MLEIINQRYMFFLFEIAKKPRNISELAKKGDLTLSVASTLISRWAREGVILKQRAEKGNEIIILLTDYGKEQTKLLKELNNNHKKNKKELNGDEIKAVSLVKDNQINEEEVKNDS